jgi:Gpi18-like mannosyltransferase
MVGWTAASVGIATAGVRAITVGLGMSAWATAAVLVNPGVWLSARLLTADAMALALVIMALLAFLRNRKVLALILLVLAALARETSILVAIGLAGYELVRGRARQGVILASVPSLALAAWLLVVEARIGGVLESADNFTTPMAGIISSASVWSQTPARDQFFVGITLSALVAAALLPWFRPSLWRWLVWPWLGLATILSHWAWDFGNNAARTMAPLMAFVVVAAFHGRGNSGPQKSA